MKSWPYCSASFSEKTNMIVVVFDIFWWLLIPEDVVECFTNYRVPTIIFSNVLPCTDTCTVSEIHNRIYGMHSDGTYTWCFYLQTLLGVYGYNLDSVLLRDKRGVGFNFFTNPTTNWTLPIPFRISGLFSGKFCCWNSPPVLFFCTKQVLSMESLLHFTRWADGTYSMDGCYVWKSDLPDFQRAGQWRRSCWGTVHKVYSVIDRVRYSCNQSLQ